MAQNNDYWAERFARLKQQEMQKADNVNAQLLKEYSKSLQKLRTDVVGWYERYARENNMSYADALKELTARELKAFKLDLEEYVNLASDKKLSQKYKKLPDKASIRARLTRSEELYIRSIRYVEELAKKTNTSLEKLLPDVYKDSMYKTAYETQRMRGKFETFAQVDDKTANTVIKKPWASDGQDFSQRIWKDRENLAGTLQREMSFSFMAKEGVDPLTERISKRFNVSYNNARRLVETETAYIQEKGMLDTYDELGIEQYQIAAVLDSRTSEICQKLDGKRFDRKDAKPGLTMPPFHCSCRSTTVPYIPGITDDEGETVAMRQNKDGKTKFVNARLTYQEWEKKYLKPAPKSTPKSAPASKPKTKQDMINNIIANAQKNRLLRCAERRYNEVKRRTDRTYYGIDKQARGQIWGCEAGC